MATIGRERLEKLLRGEVPVSETNDDDINEIKRNGAEGFAKSMHLRGFSVYTVDQALELIEEINGTEKAMHVVFMSLPSPIDVVVMGAAIDLAQDAYRLGYRHGLNDQ